MKKIQPSYVIPAARQKIGRALLAGALCWSAFPLHAQNPPPGAPQQIQPGAQAMLNQDDLRELLGPIALYPDALIAIILPASTVPADVVLGSRFVENKGDPGQAGDQPWDDSVKSLVYYPDVLSWMNENLEWTASVGEAFMDQPADVMNAIQSLRAQARASGALSDTPQQKVVVQEEFIRIVPADPEVIYVPQYDPEVIFVESYSPGYTPFITFGFGFAVGSWMSYDCDWGRRGVYRGDWIGWNRGGRGWNGGDTYVNNTVVKNTNVNVVNINNATQWNPSNRSRRQIEKRQQNGNGNVRFTTAEARATRELIRTERRNNNGKLSDKTQAAARRDALPNPKKLELREASFKRTAKAENRDNRPDNDAPVGDARKDRDNVRPNAPAVAATERQEQRRKTPTEAPRVKDQIETPRQTRKSEKADEPRREAAQTRQTTRDQAEERQNNVPERQNKANQADRPSERPAVAKRQADPAPAPQNNRAERQQRSERQEPKAEKPKAQQQVRQPQPRQVEREQTRPEPKRQEARQNVERPQQQKRQEAKPQQKQENRSANRPQQQQQAQPQKAQKKDKKSDDPEDKKKKD